MELTHDDVIEILALIEGSDVGYLDLEVAGTRILVDRSGGSITPRRQVVPEAAVATVPAPTEDIPPEPADVPAPAEALVTQVPRADVDRAGLVSIDSPMVGVFYRAPEPGAPPHIEVGHRVDAGTTVGLVEVMKMFNSVTADVPGVVEEILVANEEFVEYGQPLVLVRPEPKG